MQQFLSGAGYGPPLGLKITAIPVLLLTVFLCGCRYDPVTHEVWAVHDGQKVDRADLADPNKASNSVWDGRRIRLFGARNEIVAFQLIVEAGPTGIGLLDVELTELRHETEEASITYREPAADPTNYVGRPIQIFTVNYMEVLQPTKASWIYRRGSPSAPANPLGWKPVQLVPETAQRNKGGLPVQVEALRNQAVWLELYIDRNLPAGRYQGEVTVRLDEQTIELPMTLTVFDFALPDENSVNLMVFYQSSQPELYHGRNLDDQYHRFAHRNRIELVQGYDIASAQEASGRFTGSDFTPAQGYEGCGQGVGNRIVPASFYGPGTLYNDRESAWRQSDAWMKFLATWHPQAITFLYMRDEPRKQHFNGILQIADNIHSNPGPGGRLPIFVTRHYTEELDGAIDIWDTGPQHYDIEVAERERSRGREYWIYNGGRPNAGAIVIDAPATDARATIWACFKHDIDVYFYWHGVHWKHNRQKVGERIQNVWANPITFDNRGEERYGQIEDSFANGDGVLIYPGEDKLHPQQDRGVPGPVSTFQLANFRRGAQDHLYLTLARRLGLESLVREELAKIVPRVFSDAVEKVGFSESGNEFEESRLRLGRAIEDAMAEH